MAGLTKRNGMWYATWKQNGTTIKRATGFPVGSTREEQRKNKLYRRAALEKQAVDK